MRIASLVLLASFTLTACSTAEQSDSAPSGSATLNSGTAGSGTTDPAGTTGGTFDPVTSGQGATTSDGTTAATSPGTESGTVSASSTGTGSTGADTATGTTDATTGTGTDTTTGTGTDTTTGTTGGMGGGPCEVDADCKLHDDCCSCYAIPAEQNDPSCDLECDQSQCASIGIDKAVCRFGQCTLEKVDCSSQVACDALPPNCPPGTLPSIEGACWSGHCVPAEACDKVPDCKLCPDSTMCVEYQAWVTDKTCEPIPADCGGEASCDCAGSLACADPYTACNEGVGDSDLVCSCPAC